MGRYTAHLVGESHYQSAVTRLRPGAPVQLVPEPENRHDPRAVRATSLDGATLGYVERESWLTGVVLDQKATVAARVHELIGGGRGEMTGVVLEVVTAADADRVIAEGWGERLAERNASPPDSTRLPAEDPPHTRRNKAIGKGCAVIVAVFLGLAVIGALVEGPQKEPSQAGTAAAPAESTAKLSAADVKVCRDALAALEETGLIRERRDPATLVVEESAWAALPYRDKLNLLSAASCDVWQTATPPDGKFARAEGYRNGSRLLTMSTDNVF